MARIDPHASKVGLPARPAKEYSQQLHYSSLDVRAAAADVFTPSCNQVPGGRIHRKVTPSMPKEGAALKTIKKSTGLLHNLGTHLKKFLKP